MLVYFTEKFHFNSYFKDWVIKNRSILINMNHIINSKVAVKVVPEKH